jgi:hypothetical protein
MLLFIFLSLQDFRYLPRFFSVSMLIPILPGGMRFLIGTAHHGVIPNSYPTE